MFMMVGMAAGNVTLAFGDIDFWPEVVVKYQEFFRRSARLQEAVRSIVDPAYEGLDGGQQTQLNMLMLTATGVAETVTLVGNGMGHGAMKIVRGGDRKRNQHGIHAAISGAGRKVSGVAVG
jgi:hypothetical protein